MSLTCMLHSLDRHTVGNQNIITLSHTAANSGVATIQNSRAALTLNFHMKVGATKYRPAGRNWPAGREFETPALEQVFFQSTLFFLHTLQAPTYPVDDFRLKGADDAAVVEDWMFLITLFKGCGCLRGEQGHVVIALQSTVGSVYVCVCEALSCCVCVPVHPLGGN